MFPEYRDLITRLKTEGTNHRFLHLFEKHNELDHKITALENHDAGSVHAEIEALKKEKLHIKDELYTLLRQEGEATAK
ncbi:MAG: DUF465 domain-containing protein [Ottowia sp.]|uniref:DUF465 domain-containing protein n=1 Tax=Ottowia sp. TaxID=1898956 RepID=UPI001DB101F7|nr:DUF465 domain-containing protein [Ottowia sp.]MCP5257930.1 DUF465 domain-containing protein [Burkholderiaceae bacterium]MCB2023548.1 DUF465 domain-containing protein [Ottowia sp.]MCB2032794.1 DUF465 domain-containing protein [Ottowia sp.]MCB2036543.1 DUF465 domain-containing protein [Ottowia sp.]MCB2069561.1 DUF465 domain-containing protein [Ottowia sp.]